MTLNRTWFLSKYKTSYLKQAVTSLPHQSSICNTEDPTNHITEPGRCYGNFSIYIYIYIYWSSHNTLYIHTHMHTCTCARVRARAHTHTHTHTDRGSPQWPGIHRPSSPCSSACFTQQLKCWPPASKSASHLLKIFLNTQNSSSCNNGNFPLNTVFQFLQWMWTVHTSISLRSNPTAVTMGNNLVNSWFHHATVQ